MSRPSRESLFSRRTGEAGEALVAVLAHTHSTDLGDLEAKVWSGEIKAMDVLGARLGGSVTRPGLVARYLFTPSLRPRSAPTR